jgi:hypothetical protein
MARAADAPIFQAYTAIPAGDLPSASRPEMPVGVLTAPASGAPTRFKLCSHTQFHLT